MNLTFANIGTLNVFEGITIEEWDAFFAMLPLSMMLAIVTNSSANASGMFIDGLIEMATGGVIVAITFCRNIKVFII